MSIKEFTDIATVDNEVLLRVCWRSFDDAESDWVPIALLNEDVPDMTREFVHDIAKNWNSTPAATSTISHLNLTCTFRQDQPWTLLWRVPPPK